MSANNDTTSNTVDNGKKKRKVDYVKTLLYKLADDEGLANALNKLVEFDQDNLIEAKRTNLVPNDVSYEDFMNKLHKKIDKLVVMNDFKNKIVQDYIKTPTDVHLFRAELWKNASDAAKQKIIGWGNKDGSPYKSYEEYILNDQLDKNKKRLDELSGVAPKEDVEKAIEDVKDEWAAATADKLVDAVINKAINNHKKKDNNEEEQERSIDTGALLQDINKTYDENINGLNQLKTESEEAENEANRLKDEIKAAEERLAELNQAKAIITQPDEEQDVQQLTPEQQEANRKIREANAERRELVEQERINKDIKEDKASAIDLFNTLKKKRIDLQTFLVKLAKTDIPGNKDLLELIYSFLTDPSKLADRMYFADYEDAKNVSNALDIIRKKLAVYNPNLNDPRISVNLDNVLNKRFNIKALNTKDPFALTYIDNPTTLQYKAQEQDLDKLIKESGVKKLDNGLYDYNGMSLSRNDLRKVFQKQIVQKTFSQTRARFSEFQKRNKDVQKYLKRREEYERYHSVVPKQQNIGERVNPLLFKRSIL